jgi:hypothetical protein
MGGIGATNLISSLVTDHDEETSMVGFDAICDECWYPRVQLFPHDEYALQGIGYTLNTKWTS